MPAAFVVVAFHVARHLAEPYHSNFMYDRWRIANLHRDIDDMPMVSQLDRLAVSPK
jgi:hypothetical protein